MFPVIQPKESPVPSVMRIVPAGGTVYVSDGATPVILSLQETGGQLAFLDFTNFNAPVTITAPPAADIFYGTPSLD